MKVWPKVGSIVKLIYGKKYPGMPYFGRHAKIMVIAKAKPMNCLVKLREGTQVVVPIGNCMIE